MGKSKTPDGRDRQHGDQPSNDQDKEQTGGTLDLPRVQMSLSYGVAPLLVDHLRTIDKRLRAERLRYLAGLGLSMEQGITINVTNTVPVTVVAAGGGGNTAGTLPEPLMASDEGALGEDPPRGAGADALAGVHLGEHMASEIGTAMRRIKNPTVFFAGALWVQCELMVRTFGKAETIAILQGLCGVVRGSRPAPQDGGPN